jgi:hypothetical protein
MPGMGQVALGFRSLLVKVSIFVVMAALLAWTLGGTLFPQPVQGLQGPVLNTPMGAWAWQVTTRLDVKDEPVIWHLVQRSGDGWIEVQGGGPFMSVVPLGISSAKASADQSGLVFSASVDGYDFKDFMIDADGVVPWSSVSETAGEASP